MKATLYPRKKIRLKWFKVENIPYDVEQEVEIWYSVSAAQYDNVTHKGKFQYIFKNLTKDIVGSDLILLEQGLPTHFSKTAGSVAGKLTSEKQVDTSVKITDRLVKVDRGKEEIKREPPEYPDPNIKEIETRKRTDVIQRKITVKNESNKKIESFKIKITEGKEVRYNSSTPEPEKIDKPEYTWSLALDPDQSGSIEVTISVEIVKTFKIEKEKPVKYPPKSY